MGRKDIKPMKPIPRISMDEETDYEFDEYENYQKFRMLQPILFALFWLYNIFFQLFTQENDLSMKECNICYERYPQKRLINCKSNHTVCGKCFRKIVKNHIFPLSLEKLSNGFPCPDYECNKHLEYEVCEKFMPRKSRQHIQNRIYRAVLKVKSLQYDVCKRCGNLSKTIQNRIFYCCNNTICYYCEKEYNFRHTIDDCKKQEEKTKISNDLLSTALIHRCHKCKLPFLKIDDSTEACNIIKCKCGVTQCYACRQPAGYGHQCSSFDSKAFDIHNRDLKKAEANLKC